ncbi:MAG TPA: hypothetical protein VLV83_22060 [Acidobacteriota bacterium]|nr:hypothetical protein [Acidobacteriota bacterium]
MPQEPEGPKEPGEEQAEEDQHERERPPEKESADYVRRRREQFVSERLATLRPRDKGTPGDEPDLESDEEQAGKRLEGLREYRRRQEGKLHPREHPQVDEEEDDG